MRQKAKYILYWAQMNRRVDSNHALNHAVNVANEHGLPLLVYEAVTCSYPHANDRLHTFLLEGVPPTSKRLHEFGIGYMFYLRRRGSDSNHVLYDLVRHAAALVTDDYPVFVAHTHNASVPEKIDIPYIAVESSCVVPIRCFDKRQYAAYTIRPRIHKLLPEHMKPAPLPAIQKRYDGPAHKLHTNVTEKNIPELVASCEIDHGILPSLSFRGGSEEAAKHFQHYLEKNLKVYAERRNNPASHATSDLSPYLHFGHISSLQIALDTKEYAQRHKLVPDAFLEELIVRRELAFNFASFSPSLDSLEVIPDWAQKTLQKHAKDPRPQRYTVRQLAQAQTYDDIWNATQKELLLRGKIHGYYRMYWGKKIVEWSRTPQDAVNIMIDFHDRYALDGRDPNTYTNILWCLGLHDRPFQERPIFGQVRYMSYDGLKRKTDVAAYLREIEHMEQTGIDPFRI